MHSKVISNWNGFLKWLGLSRTTTLHTWTWVERENLSKTKMVTYLGHGHKWAPASVRGLWKLWFMFLQIQVDERCCKEDTVAYVKFWLMCQFKNTERQVSVNLKSHDIICTSGIGIYSMICDHICHTSRKMSMILSVCSPTRCFRKFTWHFLQKKMFLIRSWSQGGCCNRTLGTGSCRCCR